MSLSSFEMDGRRAAGWFMTVPRALAPQMLQTQMAIREAVPHVGAMRMDT